MKLLTNGKGIYPYSLCNDAHIMKKIVKFPPIEEFFNDLTNTPCPIEDYNFGFKYTIPPIVKTYTNILCYIITLTHYFLLKL